MAVAVHVDNYFWTDCTAHYTFCDILAIHRDLDHKSWEDDTPYSVYKSFGNAVVSNTIGDDLYLNDQDYYQSGNTYDTLYTTDSTDAGSTSLDTTSWTCEEYGLYCVPADSTIARVADLDGTCAGSLICAGYGAEEYQVEGLNINGMKID